MALLRIIEVLVGLALWTDSFGFLILKVMTLDPEKWAADIRKAPKPSSFGWLWNFGKLVVGLALIMRVL